MCPGGDHREIDRMRIRLKTKQGRVWFKIAPPLELLHGRMPEWKLLIFEQGV